MSDLNDLNKPVTTDTEPNVLDTLRGHLVRAATWAGWSSTANKVAGIMSAVTLAVSGGRSMRLYRRNDANNGDEEVVSLPGVSVGGNAGTASAAQSGSTLESTLAAKAPLNSPALTGTPTVPTAGAGTATTQAASTAFVATAVANVVNSSPAALDTLNELATALGNDPNFATSTATALGNRVVRTSANRPGVFRLYRNDADSSYNVQTNWTGTRWRLKGYAADTFHAEAEVGYADSAGSAATASALVGTATFPDSTVQTTSARGFGFKNRLINGASLINQRGVSGTVVLAAGVYGHDRFKAGATGCTYTFSTSGNVTTFTISAGSLIQVVEGLNLETGTYCLSWAGTVQGKIGGGSYAASGITGTITGGTNTNIEFGTGTLSLPQLERGSTANSFDYRPYGTELALCQRYYVYVPFFQLARADLSLSFNYALPVTMRGAPTVYTATNNSIVYVAAITSSVLLFTPGGANTGVASNITFIADAEL